MEIISINNFLLRNHLPSAPAIITADKTFTYNQLARYSNSARKYFSQKGITENGFVGIFGEHTIDFVISVLALWKLGAIPVLLNPKVSQNELNEFLQSANCSLLVGSEDQLMKYTHYP